ncbi:MAG: GNAT family N-acetyltransferase [Promethearchaeota archaeon]
MREAEFNIRSAKSEDWQIFHQIDKEIFPEDSTSKEHFNKRVEHEGFFILEDKNNQMIGYLILARFGDDAGHLGRIGVAQSMQNKGWGTKLMNFALKWFEEQNITKIILYTQEENFKAQNLYKKFNFKIIGTTWHYFVPLGNLQPLGKYNCRPIEIDEIDVIGEKFNVSLPSEQIRRFLAREQLILIVKDPLDQIIGALRYDPTFPGCFPFEIEELESFDDILDVLKPYQPKFDYIRLTFTDNYELAELLENRGYKLHHKLFKMVLDFSQESNQESL